MTPPYDDVAGSSDAVTYERMEQRAYGLLLEELLERHDGSEMHALPPVRATALAATAEPAAERPGFAALVKMLHERPKAHRRPRGTFGRVPAVPPHHGE